MKTIGKIFLWIFILALASEHPQVLGIVAIWLCWKVYHKYWLPQLAENKQLEALSQKTQLEIKLRPFISEYLKAFTSIWDVWPTKIVLNNYDYTSIRNLITKEKGIDSSILSEPEFNKIVDGQLYQAGYELFFKSFTKQIEQIVASSVKPAIMSKEFLIGAYYATFAQNKTYINFLASFSVNYGCPMQAAEIEIALTKLNQRIAIEKRSDSIKAAVASGGSVMKNIDIHYIDSLDGVAFEQVLGKLYEQMGYDVQFTKASGDQGADLLLSKAGEKRIVQAKRYKDAVSNTAIQEAVAAKAYYKYSQASVVTSNYFTSGAKELAAANGVDLVDRNKLIEWLQVYPIVR